MKNNPDSLPFNPFSIELDGDTDESENMATVELTADQVPYCADGFDELALVVDWAPSEIDVLSDAAKFVRWSAVQNQLPESEVVRNRLNQNHGVTLVIRQENANS